MISEDVKKLKSPEYIEANGGIGLCRDFIDCNSADPDAAICHLQNGCNSEDCPAKEVDKLMRGLEFLRKFD